MKKGAGAGKQKPTGKPRSRRKLHPLLQISQRRLGLVMGMISAKGPLDVDFVHDLRTHSRRLTEVIGIFKPVLPGRQQQRIANAVRRLRRGAGALRDLDVITETLEHLTVPAKLKPAVKELRDQSPARRLALEAALGKVLSGETLQKLLQQLATTITALATDHPQETEERLLLALRKRIAKRRRQMHRQWSATGRHPNPQFLHQARIAAKKYRYAAELLAEIAPVGTAKLLTFLKQAQSLLGDHHDTEVLHLAIDRALRHRPDRDLLLPHREIFLAGLKVEQVRREALFQQLKTRILQR